MILPALAGLGGLLDEAPGTFTAQDVADLSGSLVLKVARYFGALDGSAARMEAEFFRLFPPGQEENVSAADKARARQFLSAAQFLRGAHMLPANAQAVADLANSGLSWLRSTPAEKWPAEVRAIWAQAEAGRADLAGGAAGLGNPLVVIGPLAALVIVAVIAIVPMIMLGAGLLTGYVVGRVKAGSGMLFLGSVAALAGGLYLIFRRKRSKGGAR